MALLWNSIIDILILNDFIIMKQYELVSNMIQQSIYIKNHAVKEVSDKLVQTEAIIGEYQEKVKSDSK